MVQFNSKKAENNMNNNMSGYNSETIKKELARVNEKGRFYKGVKGVIVTLVVVAAIAVLVATLVLPVLQIYGTSMTPTMQDGDIVVSVKGSEFEQGDIIAFYYNNKILVKRAIAFSGGWVDIDSDGNVSVNGVQLDEPYVDEKSLGECDITLPYQVPEGKVFVMGDHRATSKDSRSTEVGTVSEEQVVGKIVFRVWPLDRFGRVS